MTGLKLAGLAVFCTLLVLVHEPVMLAIAVLIVVIFYAISRISIKGAWEQVKPIRWFAVALFATQVIFADVPTAITATVRIVLAVAMAGLVTLTTPTSVMLATIERGLAPLRLLKIDPFRISLLLTLTLRTVPLLSDLATRVREAQRARGVTWSVRAFAVPLVVGALRHADALGEALSARGLDD
ncbi:energy-coupling factor transporter transmembrane component T family protein [Nonomuraea sp. NPDC050556]|uniref:energy-coupling factor transporter transmembrane component T family protein n=1 Tax=Nonomuraea sp. NPDC050556 TaxID=3364369 RepID=UPI0037907FFA